jgi:hypothetical protein
MLNILFITFFFGFTTVQEQSIKVVSLPNHDVKQDTAKVANPNKIVNEAAFFALLDLKLPQLRLVKMAVDKKDWNAAKKAWGNYLQTRKSPKWIWSHHDKQKIRDAFNQKFGGVNYYNKSADKTLARIFTFNDVTLKLNKEFKWRSGTPIWEQLFSRHDFIRELAYAYLLTGKNKYAKDFNQLIKGWVKQHPVLPDITKTWNGSDKAAMSLETGLRMDRWMDIMEAFWDAPEFDSEARYLMTKSMVEQMRYLDGWIVNYRIGNWQMSEAAGMSYVGIMFPEFKSAAAWREKGFKFLKMHMDKDIYPDGTHIEVTPGYHIGVIDQCIRMALVTKANGYTVPGLLDKHEKMYDFILDITKPNFRYTGVGDARNSSARGVLGMGALFYRRPDLHWIGVEKPLPEWLWILGPDKINSYKILASSPPKLRSVLLPDSKYAILRTGWEENDKFLMLDCAPSLGSHSHGDRLQVIAYSGRDLLIDPGQYSYSEPLVEYFRTAKAHNVLVIDGKEQEKVDPKIKSWYIGNNLEYVSGSMELKNITHQRTAVFVKPDYWIVVDHLDSKEEHEYTRQFQFSVGSNAYQNGKAAFTEFTDGTNLMVYPTADSRVNMVNRPIPSSSNTTIDAQQATFTTRGKTTILATVLYPFSTKNSLPKIEELKNESGVITIQLTFPDGHIDKLGISASETDLKINDLSSRGTVLYVRKNINGNEEIIK